MPYKILRNAVALATGLVATTASAETLILATDLPPKHFLSTEGAEAFMECVTERTNGEITFNYFPSGELVKRDGMVDALNNGLAHIAHSSPPDETATIPLQGIVTLPGLSDSALASTVGWRKALDTGGVMAQEFSSQNVRPILLAPLAPYQIMSKDRLDSPDKWDGVKIRATGSSLSFLVNAAGGVAVQMPATELYVALQRGTVDATILSFTSLVGYSIQEVVGHYSTNASFGTSALLLGMDLNYFNSMSEEGQKAIDECGRSTEISLATLINENEGKIAADLAAEGQDVYELTPEQLDAFAEKLASVEEDFIKRLTERGLPASEALGEYKAALSD